MYSPHTAVDAAGGGLNDWLADIVVGNPLSSPDHGFVVMSIVPDLTRMINSYRKTYNTTSHTRSVIIPVKDVPDFSDAGYGRLVRFKAPQELGTLVSRIRLGLGSLNGLSVAVPQDVVHQQKPNIPISSVGICAGSGGSLLNGLDVDLLFTGELSHHEALAAIEKGKCVITAFHSNTERKYLRDRMAVQLKAQIVEGLSLTKGLVSGGEEVSVGVSKTDRDPYELIMADQAGW